MDKMAKFPERAIEHGHLANTDALRTWPSCPSWQSSHSSVVDPLERHAQCAAVDHERGTRDVAPCFASEQERGAGELLRFSPTAERRAIRKDFLLFHREQVAWQVGQER